MTKVLGLACGPPLRYLPATKGFPRPRPYDRIAHTTLDISPRSRQNKTEKALVTMLLSLIIDAVCDLGFCLRPSPALAAENLFLRKQLAWYQERQAKPRQAASAIRLAMVWRARSASVFFAEDR